MRRRPKIAWKVLAFSTLSFFAMSCKGSLVQKKLSAAMGDQGSTSAPAIPPEPPAPPPPPTVPQDNPPPPVAPPPPTVPSDSTVNPPANSPQGNSDQGKAEEINRYVACINRTMPRTKDSLARYLSWVDAKNGPNCKEPYISYGLYTLYDDGVAKCQDAARLGSTSGPSLPTLEKGATELAAAYAELVPLTKKAEDYYQQEDYKDDNCAKAREMHVQLMAAFGRYMKAYDSMKPDLSALKDQTDRAELDKIEKEQGKKLTWYIRSFGISSKGMMDTIPEANPMQMNTASYLAKYAMVDKDFESMTGYASANSAEASSMFWYSAFERSAKEFFKQAKFLKRDLSDGNLPRGEQVKSLVEDYNRMISDLNNIHN